MRDVVVLCYHAVSPNWQAALSVTPEQFESQIDFLLRRHWQPVTFTEAVLAPPARRTLAISFDDGFRSVTEYALPILQRRQVPATLFAPTAFMNGGQQLSWPGVEHWRDTSDAAELTAVDWDDLARLARLGWEIGSHTCTHPRLTQLDDDALMSELQASREQCSTGLGQECRAVAYPYGDVDVRVAGAAKRVGYVAGAALSSSLANLGPHRHPRIGIYHIDYQQRFRLKLARPVRQLKASRLLSVRP